MNLAPTKPAAKPPTIETAVRDQVCLCGDYERDHDAETGEARMRYRDHGDSVIGYVACDQYIASPYFCSRCHLSAPDPRSAIECCLCMGCGHLLDSHRFKTDASVKPANVACREKGCDCGGFGCVIPGVEAA